MDTIQKVLVKAGRKDLAQEYYLKVAAQPKMWLAIVGSAYERWSKPSINDVKRSLLRDYDEILKSGTCRGSLFVDETKAKEFKSKNSKSSEKSRTIIDLIAIESAEYENGSDPNDNKYHYLDPIKNIKLTSSSKSRLEKELHSQETEGFGWVYMYSFDIDSLIQRLQTIANAKVGEAVEVKAKLSKNKPDTAELARNIKSGMKSKFYNALFRVSMPESEGDKIRFVVTDDVLKYVNTSISSLQKEKNKKDIDETDKNANGIAVLPYRAFASFWLKHSSPDKMCIADVQGFGRVIGSGTGDFLKKIFRDGTFIFHDQTGKPLTDKLKDVECYTLSDYAKKIGKKPEEIQISGTLK
jgi:hypothetical protein